MFQRKNIILAVTTGIVATLANAQSLDALSDEFDNASTLTDWQRVNETESWNADQLESWDIDNTTAGHMRMMPHTAVWYNNWRGPLVFKLVSGDFVFSTRVTATGRDGVSIPQSAFSLAGPMIRSPQDITPATWTTGIEDYVFFSIGHGAGDVATSYRFERKSTDDGNSTLVLSPSSGGTAVLQIARIGDAVILVREQDDVWAVHARYSRSDFPDEVQVGLVTYTDWNKCNQFAPVVHNANVLAEPLAPGVVDPDPGRPFNPDLIADFDYARFARPVVPVELVGLDLTDPAQVSDAELLAFLGANANVPGAPCLGDLNGDDVVDLTDLSTLLSAFGSSAMGDVDGDGDTDLSDLSVLLGVFGASC